MEENKMIENLTDKQLVVTDENGNEVLFEILFTYEHPERNKKYVFVYEKDNPDEVMAFEYTDNGELLEIESDEEYEEVEEVFNAFNDEGEEAEDED